MRLFIDITPSQHQRLKAAAAIKGQSIKNYVLERTLPDANEKAALDELEKFLKTRIQSAESGDFSSRSVDEIFKSVLMK